MLSSLAGAAFAPARARRAHERRALPRPTDTPRASAPGPDPDRLLIAGSGPAAGWGVRSHQLGLPGSLAQSISAMTGRGADVDVRTAVVLPIASVGQALHGLRLWRYDAIVLTVGTEDALALISLREWERRMAALIALVQSSTSSSTPILVAGIGPIAASGGFDPLELAAEAHARRMNEITRELALLSPRVRYLSAPDVGDCCPARLAGCPHLYRRWAELVACVAAPEIHSALRHPESSRTLRDQPDEEPLRQRAVSALPPMSASRQSALGVLADRARELAGAAFAAVTVIDGDVQRYLAQSGFAGATIPRVISFCNETIRRSGTFIVPDARIDDRFRANPLVTDGVIRFYAGFPVESAKGFRVGALCVFDRSPQTLPPVEAGYLRDLAKLVEREIN